MPLPFKLTGVAAMAAKLWRVSADFPDVVAAAMYAEAQVEMREAKRLTPVDTGALRASGFVQEPVRAGNNITVTLAFGGPAEDYAFIVHEDLEAFHAIGQAKFLERPLKESAPFMGARIAHRITFGGK